MKQLASLQQEQDALQQDYEEQKEKMSWWVCTPGASPYPIQSPLGTPNPIPWLIPIHPLASGGPRRGMLCSGSAGSCRKQWSAGR